MTNYHKISTWLLVATLVFIMTLFVLGALTISIAHAQNRPGIIPDYRDWGPDEQQRRMPPMPRFEERPRYDDQERYGGSRPMTREQYEQRSYCAMHPRACQ